jgi:hypothetical protein
VTTSGRVAVLCLVATAALGGCRAAVAPAPSPPAVSSGTAADPLGGVEHRLDQIERQIDQDGTR